MVRESSARLLALLGLLQSRTVWTGGELAARLDVSARTIRNDIDRLRRLDYPVDAVRGRDGHYRLGIGAKLPPLLLDDEEAVAITVGLRRRPGSAGIEETSARALAKLQAILPHRLRRQVDALRGAVSAGPENTGSNVPDPEIEVGLLTAIAAAIRDREEIRFATYDRGGTTGGQVEPYRLVSWQRRWYLVGRTARTDGWSTYRLDWMRLRTPGRAAVHPGRPARRRLHRLRAPRGRLRRLERAHPDPGRRARGRGAGPDQPGGRGGRGRRRQTCVLVTGGDSVEIIAVYIGMLGLDFFVDGPPELVAQLRWSESVTGARSRSREDRPGAWIGRVSAMPAEVQAEVAGFRGGGRPGARQGGRQPAAGDLEPSGLRQSDAGLERRRGKRPKRDWRAVALIAAVVSQFDVIAVQEVRRNLTALRFLISQLGAEWRLVTSDVTVGDAATTSG